MTLYGFEGYNLECINSGFFDTTYASDFKSYFRVSRTKNLTYRMKTDDPIYDLFIGRGEVEKIKNNPLFRDKHYMPNPGESIFFDKACTIPRIKCEDTWKRTVKLANAATVVVPEPSYVEHTSFAIFLNAPAGKIYMMQYWRSDTIKFPVGTTIGQLVNQAVNTGKISSKYRSDAATQAEVQAASSAICIFIGEVMHYGERQQFMFDIIDGLYPKIVYEADLMQALGTEEQKFDADFMVNILELLNSKDRDTVHHGMRILANMDYTHFPAVTKYILRETENSWSKHKPYNSSVKFMLDRLEGLHYPFQHVTAEEFALAKPIFEEIVKQRVQNVLNAFRGETNMQIIDTFAVDLTLPESEEPQQPEDDCPDCPKVEEVDFGFIQN